MTNKDFAIAANKFFYYAMNFQTVKVKANSFTGETTEIYAPEFFNAFDEILRIHLLGKWEYAYDNRGPYGAVLSFYSELDGNNRAKMLNWINENYSQPENFGICLESCE